MQDNELAAFGEMRTPLEMILLDRIKELEQYAHLSDDCIDTQVEIISMLDSRVKQLQNKLKVNKCVVETRDKHIQILEYKVKEHKRDASFWHKECKWMREYYFNYKQKASS